MMGYSANDIPGNRLKIEKPVTVFLGHPNSSKTEIWKEGFTSPPVYSWVEDGEDIYWQIGELKPQRYVKHDPDKLEVVADSGGAKYLKDDSGNGSFFDFSNFIDTGFKNIVPIVKGGALLIALVIGWNIYQGLK